MLDELRRTADGLGFALDDAAAARLGRLMGLWRSHARAINLTGARTDEALREHVEDGLAVVACAREVSPELDGCDWLDVGSGGGFPALVVAAVTSARLVLVEPRQRRAAFLEFALAAIGNKSSVLRGRIDDPTWDEYCVEREKQRGNRRFAIATSRAVFGPDAWLALGDNLVLESGFVLVHRRPGAVALSGRVPDAVVEVGGSRIEAYRVLVSG